MGMYVTLMTGDRIFHATMELKGKITYGSHKKDTVYIPDWEKSQISVEWHHGASVRVSAKAPFSYDTGDAPKNTIIVIDRDSKTALYLCTETSAVTQTLKLPYNCIVKVGRSDANTVRISYPFVSGNPHLTIRNDNGVIRVEDNNSTNGTYLNGKRITAARMKSGDVLSIICVQIKLINSELFFENVNGFLSINGIGEDTAFSNSTDEVTQSDSTRKYHRSPRTQEQLPSENIVLANAPAKQQKYEKGRGMLASLVGSGSMLAVSAVSSVASPALLAARAASMISPVMSVTSSKSGDKKRKKKLEEYEVLRKERYGAYIEDQKAKINSVAAVQRSILTRENPSPLECGKIVHKLQRNLWERTRSDRDFLDVRMGMGYEDLCVKVMSRAEASGFQMEDDETRDLAEQIIEETRIVDSVPARVSLLRNNTVGFVGNRARVIKTVKNMLVSLTTAHCFDEVKIVGIFDESERAQWEPLRWFPHTWDSNKQFRFLAFNPKDAHMLCDLFNETLKDRERAAEESKSGDPMIPGPYYIFIFGSKKSTEKEELMKRLFREDVRMGVTTLFLYDDLYSLPHGCNFIVNVDGDPHAYQRNEVNKKQFFTIDEGMSDMMFDLFARNMSSIELQEFASATELPNGISFLKGYGAETVNDLRISERWAKNAAYKSLAAPIGVMQGGKHFSLDIHEKAHGPHGLVAGTTGSGKSELLQTWILSMAVNYHPYDVAFVIIDYKGGGMANLLEPLPHVVGKITNIGSNINRSLISLRSETKRRLKLFEKYDVNHIDKYQKLYREGRASEPLPHLIIVADEFAELKKEEPEFMAGLISASRVGRSLGIHLVLATQKPAGVVDDQIWSNSRFKLCLKVQDISDSREMLKKPDAARITQAGRAYVQVGLDEVYELFQSYWSGAPYYGSSAKEEESGNPVRIIADNGQRIKTVIDEKTRGKTDVDELTAIVRKLCKVAEEQNLQKLPGPWLPELSEQLSLHEICCDWKFDGTSWQQGQKNLSVPIGMFDLPIEQRQGVQFIDFAEQGHHGIYGAPSTGKTTLLKTIVLSLGLHYSPDDVNLYIIDCGGWSMSAFKAMPHVGGIVLDCEEEKFFKLQKMILDEFDDRKRRFLKHAVSSLWAYRESVAKDIPAIVIAVDNITPVFDLYPDLEDLFVRIARDGATYGIYLLYTANGTSGVKYKIQQNVQGAFAFELTDKGDYSAIVGRLDGMTLPKTMGRAFAKGKPPVEFQAAMYSEGENDVLRAADLQNVFSQMNSKWTGQRAKPIPIMPNEISIEDLEQVYTERTMIPVGFSYETVSPYAIDLSDSYCLTVSGTLRSGKSTMLLQLAQMIKRRFSNTVLYAVDSNNGALASAENDFDGYAKCTEPEKIKEILDQVVDQLNIRKREQNKQKADDVSFDEKAFISQYPMICILIDDLRAFVDAAETESKNSMERICRMAQHLGVLILAAGSVSDLSKYNEIESLTRVIIANQKGIALGGNPSLHGYFQNNLKYNEKSVEAGAGNAFVFDNGSCTKIKLIGGENK